MSSAGVVAAWHGGSAAEAIDPTEFQREEHGRVEAEPELRTQTDLILCFQSASRFPQNEGTQIRNCFHS
jgi:hypothetical protein